MKTKKILSCVLALAMVASMGTVAFAETQTSPITVNTSATVMNVTVPTQLPISVDENGNSVTDVQAAIINNSAAQVEVTGAKVVAATDWTLKSWNTDWSKATLGTKEFAFKVNGNEVGTDGVIAATNFGVIDGNGGQLTFNYEGRIAPQNGTGTATLGNVVFTLGWAESEDSNSGNESPSTPEDSSEYKLSGTWKFNEPLSVYSGQLREDITFTSNNSTFNSIYIERVSSVSIWVQFGDVFAYEDIEWIDDSYRTVDFGSASQSVSEEFYNWFVANATQQ